MQEDCCDVVVVGVDERANVAGEEETISDDVDAAANSEERR